LLLGLGIAAALHSIPASARGIILRPATRARNAVAALMRTSVARYGRKELEGYARRLREGVGVEAPRPSWRFSEVEIKLGRRR